MNELGVQDPVGCAPLGFSTDGNAERFRRRRQTKQKHGGVFMLATMGYIALEFTGRLPRYFYAPMGIKFTNVLSGVAVSPKVRLRVGLRSSRMGCSAGCRWALC